MERISQKLFPAEELREKVTIRVMPSKMQIYPRFKELVTEKLGSDVCFVTTSLWEAFLQAMDQVPPVSDLPVEMKFMRQNVQINLGCQILYQPKKARRTPGTHLGTLKNFPFYTDKTRGMLLPQFLEQWGTMNQRAKDFWIQEMKNKGIFPAEKKARKPRSDKGIPRKKREPPSVSTPARDKPLKIFFKTWYNSMTMCDKYLKKCYGWLKRLLWSD